jgi:hypothetical protein
VTRAWPSITFPATEPFTGWPPVPSTVNVTVPSLTVTPDELLTVALCATSWEKELAFTGGTLTLVGLNSMALMSMTPLTTRASPISSVVSVVLVTPSAVAMAGRTLLLPLSWRWRHSPSPCWA